jgi:prephenate dehydrogenase
VALVSHLPQVAASALAARLVGGPDLAGRLAGPGLQDSTRVAASDAALWTEILGLNAGNLAPLVRDLADHLDRVARSLTELAEEQADGARPSGLRHEQPPDPRTAVLTDLLRRGAAGRELVPVKRGERDAAFVVVAVSVVDAPGQLASLLSAAGAGGVNVEDVRVEHVPDSPRGVIELLVRPAARQGAVQVLQDAGWDVLGASA